MRKTENLDARKRVPSGGTCFRLSRIVYRTLLPKYG
jgi:hypothetical protein